MGIKLEVKGNSLNLSGKQLTNLPQEILQHTNLQSLDLRGNQLKELPQVIWQLTNLHSLYLSNNQLKELPSGLLNLKRLQYFAVDGNPLINPPLEIVSKGLAAIREYLGQVKKQPNNVPQIYEAKSLIVGQGGVGKYNYKVFICHTSKDKDFITDKILPDLKSRGITYWIDHERVRFGDRIIQKIDDGLQNSNRVLVCVSENLKKSNWCRVEYESILHNIFENATEQKVLPLMLNDCDKSNIPLLLSGIRRAQYSNKESWEELLQHLSSY